MSMGQSLELISFYLCLSVRVFRNNQTSFFDAMKCVIKKLKGVADTIIVLDMVHLKLNVSENEMWRDKVALELTNQMKSRATNPIIDFFEGL